MFTAGPERGGRMRAARFSLVQRAASSCPGRALFFTRLAGAARRLS